MRSRLPPETGRVPTDDREPSRQISGSVAKLAEDLGRVRAVLAQTVAATAEQQALIDARLALVDQVGSSLGIAATVELQIIDGFAKLEDSERAFAALVVRQRVAEDSLDDTLPLDCTALAAQDVDSEREGRIFNLQSTPRQLQTQPTGTR